MALWYGNCVVKADDAPDHGVTSAQEVQVDCGSVSSSPFGAH